MPVIEAKKRVYKEYKLLLSTELHYIQHVSEEYDNISKLSAHQKVMSYKKLVDSIRKSIPLEDIENIIKRSADRALSKENITQLCFDAVIQDSGDANSDPYYCRSSLTINRLKRELVEQTLQAVTESLGSEISGEIQRHIASEVRGRFDPGELRWELNLKLFLFESAVVSVVALIAGAFNPLVGLVVAVVGFIFTFMISVDVNSRAWRRNVADQIHDKMAENREKVLKEISSNVKKRCIATADHLKSLYEQLENFRRRIDVVNLHTCKFFFISFKSRII